MTDATQGAAKPARKKNAHYDVYRHHPHTDINDNDVDSRVLIGENVAAPNRREAIALAAAGLPEEERYGTFMVIRSGEAKVLTRAKKTIVADDWGSS